VFGGFGTAGSKSAAQYAPATLEATMDADLDLLLTAVFVTADDLLRARQNNAARSVVDAELVTLCVAQAIMGIPSDRRSQPSVSIASFPGCPSSPDISNGGANWRTRWSG
jgi:hypothetical protein